MDLSTRENPQPGTDAPRTALRLAVILASNRKGRFAPVIGDWFLEHAHAHDDFAVELIDLGDADLPTGLSPDPGPAAGATLERISPRLAAADAFVVVTPEYNHSFPASLKALVDWHFTEWRAKPVGFVSYGGMSSGLRAVEQLRQVFAEMHAVTIRDTVAFHNAHTQFDERGRHRDPTGCDGAALGMLDQLAWWGHALRDAKQARPYSG
ncbi:NADPH-dependent FMN reductase [Streptomyces clavuligerus]|uniref:Reductase n=1 Tax=Streptomyces clavuligerus TaxID=1901 RepID=B5GQG4_STRCL|nr:NAD(P)H-dependent oxidoreductase [Streptomyces clavuligerus]EDY48560.1 reductase [Streptomyces clavuligerus]EFG06754.1 Reductase [Streptomyces clavuligerus]MBY6304979.1 NAD(P)H-dependent oxidoreductase [Streptomyces clavuligerus]QCS07704.1 NADPH-dependent oxidoreductase [Streptomyces clavuligerus]QPJ92953.1 NADPH-dependent FMN reductase [Streptomyces clavuligerus]